MEFEVKVPHGENFFQSGPETFNGMVLHEGNGHPKVFSMKKMPTFTILTAPSLRLSISHL